MANTELCVSDLIQFLPDFRESLDIGEIAFSLLAKSVIRLDQCAGLTNGEKVERLVRLLQALETSKSKPSGAYYFIVSLRETGEQKNIRGHIDLLSKISQTFPTVEISEGRDHDDDASERNASSTLSNYGSNYKNFQVCNISCHDNISVQNFKCMHIFRDFIAFIVTSTKL